MRTDSHGTRAALALALAFGASFVRAQDHTGEAADVAVKPKLILVDVARPDSFDSNARLWYSLNQSFGEVGRHVGEGGADAHWYGRVPQFLGLAYLNLAIGHYTHELGHDTHSRGWHIDVGDWSRFPWPSWVHGNCIPAYCGDPYGDVSERDVWMQGLTAGLNVEEYDAYFIYRRSLRSMSFDESMAFAFRKLSTISYDTYGSLGGASTPLSEGDVSQYKLLLGQKGIRLSSRAFIQQAALSDLLTPRLWEGVIGAVQYLGHGVRERPNLSFRVGPWRVLLPMVNLYLTPNGGFYDAVVVATRGSRVLEMHLGLDADGIGDGRVNRLRVGAEHDFAVSLRGREAELGPFAYASLQRAPFAAEGGTHVGVRAAVAVTQKLGVTARVEYSSGDILENTIKWRDEGFGATVGLSWRFDRSAQVPATNKVSRTR
jgi:hypothetical protein